jgi:hypothetical protein
MKALRAKEFRTVPGRYYGTPKEIWGFRSAPGRGGPSRIAREFLRANRDLLEVDRVEALTLRKVIESLGAWHVIFQQSFRRLRIHRAYVSVHLGRDRRVYLAKNRSVPERLLPRPIPFRLGSSRAGRLARRGVRVSGKNARILGTEKLWFPRGRGLRPAIRVRVHQLRPRREWIVYVDGATGRILSKYDNLAKAGGRASVFDPNPVATLGDWRGLLKGRQVRRPPPEVYFTVRLRDLRGNGLLEGRRVSTRLTRPRIKKADHRFLFASHQAGFEEAMVYHHLNEAMRYLESLGYRGRRALFPKPLPVDARGTRDDNSWYSPGLRSLTFGTGGVDDAEDAETILHEFGHALQDAICPDFGQSLEAAAIGEGFGDYLAASYFAEKKPAAFRTSISSWDAILDREHEPPSLRRLDEALTYESFDHSPAADEHENGKIWSAALWEIRRPLGRELADRLIVESHFQLDGFTTFARAARALLDADRNLYRGRHLRRLRGVFRRRGIGPVD